MSTSSPLNIWVSRIYLTKEFISVFWWQGIAIFISFRRFWVGESRYRHVHEDYVGELTKEWIPSHRKNELRKLSVKSRGLARSWNHETLYLCPRIWIQMQIWYFFSSIIVVDCERTFICKRVLSTSIPTKSMHSEIQITM